MTSNVVPVAGEKARRLPRRSALPAILPVAMAIVSSVSLLLLVQTSGVTTTGYDVRRLEQEREDWLQANYQIQSDIAYLQSLTRIEKEATGRLQMVPATDYVFVKVAEPPETLSDRLSAAVLTRKASPWRDEDGWSQRLLDWLGTSLGFRDR